MTKTTQITFRLAEFQPEFEARSQGEINVTDLRSALDRYFTVLRQELGAVCLTVPEASLVCDALNGTLWEPAESVRFLWASVDDAIRSDGLDRKWETDGKVLVEKLRKLTFAQSLAVCDAVERWWNRVGQGIEETHEEGLRAVGLVR
jgi:hypothetical protein